jgi:hypothetical protein
MTEPVHLSQESTNNLLQNVTRYVIPEVCGNIVYSIVSTKHDAFLNASRNYKTSHVRHGNGHSLRLTRERLCAPRIGGSTGTSTDVSGSWQKCGDSILWQHCPESRKTWPESYTGDLDRNDSSYPPGQSGPHCFFQVVIKTHSFILFSSPSVIT